MRPTDKVLVLGARGLVGSAIYRNLQKKGFSNLLTPTHKDLDLKDEVAVGTYFRTHKPQFVFLAAAKVGGIHANNAYPADFIFDNLKIQLNVLDNSHLHKVEKLIFLGSSCIYPKMAHQPMDESQILSGPLEETNKPYAIAKIAGLVMCESLNRQHGCHFFAAMPTNLYGLNDNYHPENSHVIPGLIHRIHQAKLTNLETVKIWGTGTPKREFLFSDDLAEACLFLMDHYQDKDLINIGSGDEVTIQQLAHLICEVVGFKGTLEFDSSKPDGTPRKLLDSSKIFKLGWRPKTSLKEGLEISYRDYLSKYQS